MVAARFSPAPSGMIVGISAGAHEIERHDRSTCDIDLVCNTVKTDAKSKNSFAYQWEVLSKT